MKLIISVLLSIVALIHLLPLVGVVSGQRIASAYGIAMDDPNVAILMRHRAVLFGLLGIGLLLAAWLPSHHGIGLLAGLISVVSFLLLSWAEGGVNTQVQRVVVADYFALACLLLAAALHWLRLLP